MNFWFQTCHFIFTQNRTKSFCKSSTKVFLCCKMIPLIITTSQSHLLLTFLEFLTLSSQVSVLEPIIIFPAQVHAFGDLTLLMLKYS